MKTPRPPKTLQADSSALWTAIVEEYDLGPDALKILEVALGHLDRLNEAKALIAANKTGALIEDRFGQLQPHPGIAIEQASTRLFLAGIRQLGLDLEPSSEPGRLPNPVAANRWEDN